MVFLILPCGLKNLKYLLLALYGEKFANPCLTCAWRFERRLRIAGGERGMKWVQKGGRVCAGGDGRMRAEPGGWKDEGDLVPCARSCIGGLGPALVAERWLLLTDSQEVLEYS